MKCLTPEKTLTGDCEFLAANLYAKSMFGESALANLSIEVGSNGFVQGIFMVFKLKIKGGPDPSHFIFVINVGKSRIRHRTTLNLNDAIFNSF